MESQIPAFYLFLMETFLKHGFLFPALFIGNYAASTERRVMGKAPVQRILL